MEGSLAPVDCVDEGECERSAYCVTIGVWRQLKEAIDRVVDGVTLADLARQYEEQSAPEYSI